MDIQWIIDKYTMNLYHISLPSIDYDGNHSHVRVSVYPYKQYGEYFGYELIEKYRSKMVKNKEK